MSDIVSILGGSGFVGKFLFERWPVKERGRLRFLLHRSHPYWLNASDVEVRSIDFADSDGVRGALEGSECVINLLRPDGSGWLMAVMEQLLPVINRCAIPRLIHASSIDVYGGAGAPCVAENTLPEPRTPYEREHHAMEELVASAPFSTCIIRPGAIFGPGGRNLVAFVPEMRSAPTWKLAARRSLYGQRRMHLVSVENVADAIRAIVNSGESGKIAILVTDDYASENNFAFVQNTMAQIFGRQVLDWVPELPSFVLRAVLRARGRTDAEPARRFSNDKLTAIGFCPEQSFPYRLERYATFLRETEETILA